MGDGEFWRKLVNNSNAKLNQINFYIQKCLNNKVHQTSLPLWAIPVDPLIEQTFLANIFGL